MPGRIFLLMNMGRLISLLPESRLFRLKSALYRKIGNIDVDPTAMLYSSIKIHTYPIKIGAHTHIGPRCLFAGAIGILIHIGDNCDIAPEVAFLTGTHELGNSARRAGLCIGKPIHVEDGTWIGARCLILPGVSIGKGCIVAAGSVVTRDIPSDTLAAGVPATVKKSLPPNLNRNI